MENRIEVKTYLVEFECPKCKKGTLKKGGRGFSNGSGSHWPHKCTNCDYTQEFTNITYPYFEYEKG